MRLPIDVKTLAPQCLTLLLMLTALFAGCTTTPHRGVTISDFTYPWSDKPAPKTECRLHTDAERLHFTFTVEDRDIIVSRRWTNETTVASEDRVELFFATDEELRHYWCIEIDPLGRVHDYAASHYRKFDNDWNCPGLKSSAHRTPDGYSVTGSIPLATLSQLLGRPIARGSEIRLGLFRADFYGTGASAQGLVNDDWLSWVRPTSSKPDFHVPSAFRMFALP
ncbi:MAG: carbohydrate-binding family 9-like protein [Verrucomicrobiota bacterium]